MPFAAFTQSHNGLTRRLQVEVPAGATVADVSGLYPGVTDVTLSQSADESMARAAALVALRDSRARLLAASDWTQVADAPLSPAKKAAWAAYRQALRDMTKTSDPTAAVWPDAPE